MRVSHTRKTSHRHSSSRRRTTSCRRTARPQPRSRRRISLPTTVALSASRCLARDCRPGSICSATRSSRRTSRIRSNGRRNNGSGGSSWRPGGSLGESEWKAGAGLVPRRFVWRVEVRRGAARRAGPSGSIGHRTTRHAKYQTQNAPRGGQKPTEQSATSRVAHDPSGETNRPIIDDRRPAAARRPAHLPYNAR